MFLRSLVYSASAASPLLCSGGHNCPDVLEMESGDFAVIGADITATARPHLPHGSGCGAEEKIIRVPRATLACVSSYFASSK
ncbi:MAG TPA: hypothetical protein DCE44_23750 [Verrucomicrobiales bacterium]|nr:hypothetical protein [Verrucomicrobiales bacterium]